MTARTPILLAALGLVLAGCGGKAEPLSTAAMDDVRLRDVGELYRSHQLAKQKPPKSLKDFAPFGNGAPTAYSAIRSGQVVVRYGATLPDTDEEPSSSASDEVLAYVKDVPEKGGPVLMLDRRMRTMTSDEFKAAKLAGTN
jgi:hypothetical protein